jgi:hypothetical protein
MKKLLGVILFFFAVPAIGSHIVGGEFELLFMSKNNYNLRLLYYFDVINNQFNGPPELAEPFIDVTIFRKSDNKLMRVVRLYFTSKERVSYTQPACSAGEVITDKMIYSTPIFLSDFEFGDPAGYYVIWERCCRNYTITNIISDPPTNPSNYAGQTFYLEFPPVVVGEETFVNSSPRLFPPLNDYACPNKPYYADFNGTDDDGDSLVYALTVPLSTHTGEANPPQYPAPYPPVEWQSPFSFNNIIGGNPDLKISNDGLLTVTPTVSGLFVFAVKCEEFRDGKKIGEVRRDFQMLVVSGCAPASAPKIKGRRLGDPAFTYDGDMTLTFPNTVSDADRCIEVEVTDEDAFSDAQEVIKLRAVAVGFKANVTRILPAIKSATLTPTNSSKIFRICFDKCPFMENGGPFRIALVAADDACALPLLDTLMITVDVQPPDNAPAYFTTSNVVEVVEEGVHQEWPVVGLDPDNDALVVNVITDGFIFENRGFSFENVLQENGKYESRLVWDAWCDVYDFTDRTDFTLKIVLDDVDVCKFNDADTMKLDLHVNLPGANAPVIGTTLSEEELQNGVERNVFEPINFDVFANDTDNNPITLKMQGIGFSPPSYLVSFPGATGDNTVTSPFSWNVVCEKINLEVRDDFEFLFIVQDSPNKCGIFRADSLTVNVHLSPAINTKPEISLVNLSDVPFEENTLNITLGQKISLQLLAEDKDASPLDLIRLQLISASGTVPPTGYSFTPVQGQGAIQTTFTWIPDCDIFKGNIYENDYLFRFRTIDDRCFNEMGDTLEVALTIKDVDGGDTEFIPPNFITPNGDGCNDFFGMEELDDTCGEMHIPQLPKDNCAGHFSSIRIYNRWGKEVFQSTRRNFKWFAEAEAAGVYFYTLSYTNREYKGSVTIMY